MSRYSTAQQLKLALLAEGAVLSPRARDVLRDLTGTARLSPADYASTSGIIARLDGVEWVNIPVADHNPNFVTESPYTFDHDASGFVVHGAGLVAEAEFWALPAYHGGAASNGRPVNNYVVTHGDRVRLSPTIGCAMQCTFCNIPYDDTYAGVKPLDVMLEAVRGAFADPTQPARHMLISGGTPGPSDVDALRHVYELLLTEFGSRGVDIMMVPIDGLLDLPRLAALGLSELSINLELWDERLAAKFMRHKHRRGRRHYLDFLERAAGVLGGHRVRSMLMVGIEPLDSTLAGIEAIAERGCVPVLSPFRPDPATPLRDVPPPSAVELQAAYERGAELAAKFDIALGPGCASCTHNTLTFATGAAASSSPRLERGA